MILYKNNTIYLSQKADKNPRLIVESTVSSHYLC